MAMEVVLVSSCLLGICTRYDGQHKINQRVIDYIKNHKLIPIPVCPEQLGGLSTPRPKCWFTKGDGNKVLANAGCLHNELGDDVTPYFLRGARETLKVAQRHNAKTAILQQRSPSCGYGTIYLNKEPIGGHGVTAALLDNNGLTIISDDEISKQIP